MDKVLSDCTALIPTNGSSLGGRTTYTATHDGYILTEGYQANVVKKNGTQIFSLYASAGIQGYYTIVPVKVGDVITSNANAYYFEFY